MYVAERERVGWNGVVSFYVIVSSILRDGMLFLVEEFHIATSKKIVICVIDKRKEFVFIFHFQINQLKSFFNTINVGALLMLIARLSIHPLTHTQHYTSARIPYSLNYIHFLLCLAIAQLKAFFFSSLFRPSSLGYYRERKVGRTQKNTTLESIDLSVYMFKRFVRRANN